jgi:hypothetical protein
VKRTNRRPTLSVTTDGEGLVSHAGTAVLGELADKVGLTRALSRAMEPTRKRRSAHDPGEVLVDLAVMLADGGDSLADMDVLRDQPDLFGRWHRAPPRGVLWIPWTTQGWLVCALPARLPVHRPGPWGRNRKPSPSTWMRLW